MDCIRCGWCCKNYSRINPTKEDLRKWIRSSRSDILQFFVAYSYGNVVIRGPDLTERYLDSIILSEMVNPDTGTYFDCCPFLTQEKNIFYCSIHELKPESCSLYKPWDWGERGLSERCAVVSSRYKKDK